VDKRADQYLGEFWIEKRRFPEPLRTTDAQVGRGDAESETSTDALPAFLADGEDGDPKDPTDVEEPSHAVAAE
jgi:hypothetical protein